MTSFDAWCKLCRSVEAESAHSSKQALFAAFFKQHASETGGDVDDLYTLTRLLMTKEVRPHTLYFHTHTHTHTFYLLANFHRLRRTSARTR